MLGPHPAAPALQRVRLWWQSAGPGTAGDGARLARVRRGLGLVMALLGAFAGAGLAATALRYDGSHPVNVLTAFSVLVGVQALLVLVTLLMLVPSLPGLRAVQGSLGQINPATIVAAIAQRSLRGRLPDPLRALFTWHAGRAAAGRFSKWQLLHFSQSAAITFNLAALATALALVSFTDLAFGWSTTLRLAGDDLGALTGVIALPWAGSAPQAVPDATLIEASRFFRLERSGTALSGPEAYTGWWPFLMMSMLVYGLVPRVLLWLFTGARLRAATRALLLEDARVVALLERMDSPILASTATDHEAQHTPQSVRARARKQKRRGIGAVLIWSDAVDRDLARKRASALFGIELTQAPFNAGGGASLAEDSAVVDALVALAPARVAVFVRAYEPPLLELVDILTSLRERLPTAAAIIVNPVPEPGSALAEADVGTWQRRIDAVGDPWTYVEAGL